jgi:hypothetical protein
MSTVRLRRDARFAGAAAVAISLLAVAGPAEAAATGRLTLYPPGQTISYAACNVTAVVQAYVSSFDNRPLPDCQVQLRKGAAVFPLCVGRGTIPAGFRDQPVVRIQPGLSYPCLATV